VHRDPDSPAFVTATDDVVEGVVGGAAGVSFGAPAHVPVYLCTQYTENGVTLYWDGDTWERSPSVPCGPATDAGTTDPAFDPVWSAFDVTRGSCAGCPPYLRGVAASVRAHV
jgi:hypothetical protein